MLSHCVLNQKACTVRDWHKARPAPSDCYLAAQTDLSALPAAVINLASDECWERRLLCVLMYDLLRESGCEWWEEREEGRKKGRWMERNREQQEAEDRCRDRWEGSLTSTSKEQSLLGRSWTVPEPVQAGVDPTCAKHMICTHMRDLFYLRPFIHTGILRIMWWGSWWNEYMVCHRDWLVCWIDQHVHGVHICVVAWEKIVKFGPFLLYSGKKNYRLSWSEMCFYLHVSQKAKTRLETSLNKTIYYSLSFGKSILLAEKLSIGHSTHFCLYWCRRTPMALSRQLGKMYCLNKKK